MKTRHALHRPAVIVSDKPSTWLSCRIITPNLEQSYRAVFGEDANYFGYGPTMTGADIWRLANEIYKAQPERIVFIDHMPHPRLLINDLLELYEHHPLPPVYTHVYGDFTLYTKDWLQLNNVLKKSGAHFACASHRQVDLVAKFISAPEGVVDRCHFPVDKNFYKFDPALRASVREQYQVGVDEYLMLYTGRLSAQKNTIRLLREVGDFMRRSSRKCRFILAGSFDDMGAPFFGIRSERNSLFQVWNETLRALPAELQSRVHFVGHKDSEALRGLYHAADVYVSLSCHHDEDYGMSPIESLMCGTPVVLSDWGGYYSFRGEKAKLFDKDESVVLAKVEITTRSLEINSTDFQWGLEMNARRKADEEPRRARALHFASGFSIEAATALLRAIHDKPLPQFHGFNWLLEKHAEVFSKPVPLPEGPRRGTFYEAIYDSYVKDI